MMQQKTMSGGGSMQTNTGAGTGYFVGGVPQELQAMALTPTDPQLIQQKLPNEVTMQAVGSGEPFQGTF